MLRVIVTLSAVMMTAVMAEVKLPSPDMDFNQFKKFLADMSREERIEYEHLLSENYITKYGERANNLRLCNNLDMNYTGQQWWVD